jgi:flavorubredoxin
MPSLDVTENVHWVGVNDRMTDLFEGMWPVTREGVSYNSYVIKDEKTVLVDLVKATKTDPFMRRINNVTEIKDIDYIVVNHSEPDHTGSLPIIRQLAPHATIVCTKKAAEMLNNFYGIEDNVHVIQDGETLEIGKYTLTFFQAPLLHWPDTMLTYLNEEKILFTCDAFGGFGALPGYIFDDQSQDLDYYKKEALRYFSNIVCRFSPAVNKAIKRLEDSGLEINVIAPGHGLVWRSHPEEIIGLYKQWADYFAGHAETGVTLLYASMYGNTERYMTTVAQGIAQEGVPLEIHDISRTPWSYVLPSILKYRGIVFGVPTYEAGLFPPAAHLMDLIVRKNIKHKDVAIFGSFLWSGGAQKEFANMIEKLKWNMIETREFQGGYKVEDVPTAYELGQKIAHALKERVTQAA